MTRRLAAIAIAGACGVALAAALGLWEPGWGVAAAFPLMIGALCAGVVRDPDGPEIHLFLGAALAFTAGFLVTTAGLALAELDHAEAAAGEATAVRDEIARFRAEAWPKWLAIAAGLPVGSAVLTWRLRTLGRESTRAGRAARSRT